MSAPSSAISGELVSRLAGTRVITDPDSMVRLSHDEAEWAPAGSAVAVVQAGHRSDVIRAVEVAAQLGCAIVPRGAGTGLSGGANAVDGGIVLDVSSMNRILEIDTENLLAVVEPGVVNDDLKAAVAKEGLWYPPDPASAPWSTIGGNVATNAGGLCCLKYGVTRDYVLGLEVVTGGPAGPYGSPVRLGRRTTKGVAGYDLTALLVGSEGTLGVITEITLRLRPARRSEPSTVVGAFPDLVTAGNAVAACTRAGVTPAALELLDQYCLRAVDDWKHLGIEADCAAMLLAQVDIPGAAGIEEAEVIARIFEDQGALWSQSSANPQEGEALFAARRLAYPALERLGPVLTEDVCVPRSRVAQVLAEISDIGQRHGVLIANIAHAGDGNLHPLIVTPPGDEAAREAAQAAFDEIIAAAIAHGGTVTGEHGVGLLKRQGMIDELDPANIAMQRAIKQAIDPQGLFNPGKVLGG